MTATTSTPLVTIMIATRNRPAELERTLREIRRQDYASVEMLIVNDGSSPSIAGTARRLWPAARIIRHENSAGQCARRNEGFADSAGEYLLQLDDDCSFLDPGDLRRAITFMQQHERAGALAPYIVNSSELPEYIDNSGRQMGCVASFVGAAVLFRKAALRDTEGYRTFFLNEWEEEELGLQLLRSGWQILFVPEIVAHHRLSPQNRNSSRTWMRGLRNRLWAIVMHFPLRRLPLELGWKIAVGAWDGIRLNRLRLFTQALAESVAGLPLAIRLRNPLTLQAVRRYDALRLNPVLNTEQFQTPPHVSLTTLGTFWRRWRNRARNRSVWEPGDEDTGTSYTVAYAHEERPRTSQSASDVD